MIRPVVFFLFGFLAFADCQIVSGGSESFIECPRDNYVYKDCGTCDPTCDNPNPVCTSVCQSGCFCKSGYLVDANRNCIPPNQCPQTCPVENQEFKECGGCEPTCNNLQPDCSNADCIRGCYCKNGYVKDGNGNCILPDQCPATCPGENQEYKECGGCDSTCSNMTPMCAKVCQKGCFCKSGFVKDANGNCVNPDQCPVTCSGENEEYKVCGGCEPSCNNPTPRCDKMCRRGCYCKNGFVRDANGKCVPLNRCQAVSGLSKNDSHEIYFKFYHGNTMNDFLHIKWDQSLTLLQSDKFHIQNPTMIYIHGYKENVNVESIKTVIGAYLKHHPNNNILLLDWSVMADGSYFLKAAPNTKIVARIIAGQLKKLIDNGLPHNNIHLVGHSLGAQVAGFIGRYLQEQNIKLKRITGLDPAFPMFYPSQIMGHICESDAEFVDIIHTNPGKYGAPVKTGTVDFWVNPLTLVQPGCKVGILPPMSPEDLCSHWRSWRYWAESLQYPHNFIALKASNALDYLRKINKGDKKPTIYMGIVTNTKATGDYYLRTNNKPPFGTCSV